jgi:tetratricopeptide (TPR) repeat protein
MKLFPSAKELAKQGYEALDKLRPKRALRIAKRLARIRYTASFEIAARAHWELGNNEEAIRELREGIKTAPQIYVFYSYLGHYLSDLGRYEEALDVLYRGKTLTSPPKGELEYQIAVVKSRMGDYEGAFEVADSIGVHEAVIPESAMRFGRAYWLTKAGRISEGLREVEVGLALPGVDNDPVNKAGLIATRAIAFRAMGKSRDEVLAEAYRALSVSNVQHDALELILELTGRRSASAKRAQVFVKGEWYEPLGTALVDFMALYEVVADSESDALKFIKPFEPEAVRASLSIGKVVWSEVAPGELTGVHKVQGGRTFFYRKPRSALRRWLKVVR